MSKLSYSPIGWSLMSDAEREPLKFDVEHVTTRRRIELLTVDEVRLILAKLFDEIEECLVLVEEYAVPVGEMDITLRVSQLTRPRKKDDDHG